MSLLSQDSTMQTQSGEWIAQRTLKKSSLGSMLLALKYKILKVDLQKVELVTGTK